MDGIRAGARPESSVGENLSRQPSLVEERFHWFLPMAAR